MKEFYYLENWYRTTYPDLYMEYDFLDDDGCPDGETATAKYKRLQGMIKEMRASYHKPGRSVDNFSIEAEIYEKQKEALEQGKSWHWVIENVPISRSSYLYHVRKNGALKVMHKKIPSIVEKPGIKITVKDLKLGKVMHYNSIQAAERALGFTHHTLHNYLKRRLKSRIWNAMKSKGVRHGN
ncbi:hypothetical protein ACGEN4_06595 [Limosilactobacillus mucosae]|uniref:Uncharacterized protein n=1 Tax=Limosilactobacillus mucosae TaxID=97478 RepID=A0A7L9VRW7_LIMMU|nr:hypothetical protein [Limosilactobacillus mucosae]QOL69650.1 hypothetical protein LM011_09825 [Limosilactobacillus mucosae]